MAADLNIRHATSLELQSSTAPAHVVDVEDAITGQRRITSGHEGRPYIGQLGDGRPLDPAAAGAVTVNHCSSGTLIRTVHHGKPVAFGPIAGRHPQADVLAGALVGQQLDIGVIQRNRRGRFP